MVTLWAESKGRSSPGSDLPGLKAGWASDRREILDSS